jgi:hypothetical protein
VCGQGRGGQKRLQHEGIGAQERDQA